MVTVYYIKKLIKMSLGEETQGKVSKRVLFRRILSANKVQ